jgi:hypothetical protein
MSYLGYVCILVLTKGEPLAFPFISFRYPNSSVGAGTGDVAHNKKSFLTYLGLPLKTFAHTVVLSSTNRRMLKTSKRASDLSCRGEELEQRTIEWTYSSCRIRVHAGLGHNHTSRVAACRNLRTTCVCSAELKSKLGAWRMLKVAGSQEG